MDEQLDINNFRSQASFLNSIGLGSLFSIDANGTPSGWLYDQMIAGNDTQEGILASLETQPVFQNRFKVIFDMRDRANKGENVTVPSVPQVLDYENKYTQTMSQAGVPAWFYDSTDDAQNAMRSNLTVEQIQNRIDQSYGVVKALPDDVRKMFQAFYGDATDGALIAAVLDPQKTLQQLDKATRSAAIAGFGVSQGVVVSKQQAEGYADLNKSIQQSQSDIAQVSSLQDLTNNSIGESGTTLATDVAFQAGAMGNADASNQLQNKLITRQAQQSSTGGSAISGNSGISGVGSQR